MTAMTFRRDGCRVGLIVPSVNAVIEPDLAWLSPPGVTFHATRVPLAATTPDGLREMNQSVEAAAGLLAHLAPDAVAFACTSGGFVDGEDALEAQIARIAEVTKCHVIATSRAMIEALQHIGAERISLATPYRGEVNEAERLFFESHGIGVVSVQGLGLSGAAIREVRPAEIIRLAREADRPDAQALFISCTDFRALEVVGALERELGKPVLSSNQVTLWAILRALGLPTRYPNFGGLLAR